MVAPWHHRVVVVPWRHKRRTLGVAVRYALRGVGCSRFSVSRHRTTFAMPESNTLSAFTDPATDALVTDALDRIEAVQRELRHDLDVLEVLLLQRQAV